MRTVLRYWSAILLVIVLFWIQRVSSLCGVNGVSMEPTYADNDIILVSKEAEYQRGDIVVAWSELLGEFIVKRVIGLPGDSIYIDETGLYLNGVLQSEDYVSTEDWAKSSIHVRVTVPASTVFVLGDNRVVSYDSRRIGCIEDKNIVGVVIYDLSKILPLPRLYVFNILSSLLLGGIIYMVFGWVFQSRKLKQKGLEVPDGDNHGSDECCEGEDLA